jgi:hypothetical protein
MSSVDKVVNKAFFVGCSTLLLEFKVYCYENDTSGLAAIAKSFKLIHRHLDILKELSSLSYIQYVYLSTVYNTIHSHDVKESLKELVDCFKSLKQIKQLKKGLYISTYLNTLENTFKNLVLVFYLANNGKVNKNVLAFLNIKTDNLCGATYANTLLLDETFKPANFTHLNNLNLLEALRTRLDKHERKNEDIGNIIYTDNSFKFEDLKIGDNIIALTKNVDKLFTDVVKLIEK